MTPARVVLVHPGGVEDEWAGEHGAILAPAVCSALYGWALLTSVGDVLYVTTRQHDVPGTDTRNAPGETWWHRRRRTDTPKGY